MAEADGSALLAAIPFAATLGIEVTAAGADEVSGRLTWTPELCTAGGALHGGVVMALGDTLGAICAFLNLPPDSTTATVESKTNLFRAVRGGHLAGSTRPLHVGRSFIVVQTDLVDDDGRSVAQVTQTQAVLSAD